MLQFQLNTGQPDCRLIVVPACEFDVATSPSAPLISLNGTPLQIRLRDTIDFSVDFSLWLAANGSPVLASANWAAANSSPKTPTIAGQTFSPLGKTNVVISNPSGAAVGDTYFLEITIVTAPTTPALPTDVAIGARTLVRRINILVVAG